MAIHVLAVVPLIRQLHAAIPEACQAWFADDATIVGSCSSLPQRWHHLSSDGHNFSNASKTVLVVKREKSCCCLLCLC